uniref:P-type ATPase n=1 Tax=Succinivibrio sp. TaxID=2053619 RepID=UPI00402A6936
MSGLYHKVIKLEQNYSEKKAALLEFSLRRVKGVVSACVLPNNSLSVYTNDLKTLSYALYKMELLSVKDKIKAKESEQETEIKNAADELKSYKLKALVSLVGFGLLEITKRMAPTTFTRLSFARSAFVMLIAKDIFKEGFAGLIRDKAPNADTLTATAVLASLLSGKPESSLSLLVLSNFAEMLTIGAAEKARQHISTLLDMKEKYVWLKDLDGHIRKVDIDSVKLNDRVVVYVGEKICVDGTIVEGGASIDQSSLTGESIPAYKTVGEDVYAGTVVRSGEITIEVSKVGDETNLARIINMVENAQNRRAPIQNFADRMANALVPISFLSAAVVYAVTKDIQRVLNMFFIDF